MFTAIGIVLVFMGWFISLGVGMYSADGDGTGVLMGLLFSMILLGSGIILIAL